MREEGGKKDFEQKVTEATEVLTLLSEVVLEPWQPPIMGLDLLAFWRFFTFFGDPANLVLTFAPLRLCVRFSRLWLRVCSAVTFVPFCAILQFSFFSRRGWL